MTWPAWTRTNPKDLAQYVSPQAATTLRWDFDRLAVLETDGRLGVVAAVYHALSACKITYDHESYHPTAQRQTLRTPPQILQAPGRATCLDLATLFCGLCLDNDLLPFLIVMEDHALAAVSLGHDLAQWEEHRPGRSQFQEPVTDPALMRKLVDAGHLLAVECSGAARSEYLHRQADPRHPETLHRAADTYTQDFQHACQAGRAQLEQRSLRFAVDIAVAHHYWHKTPLDFGAAAGDAPAASGTKYQIHIAGDAQGVVQGDNAKVTMHFGQPPKKRKPGP